MATTVLQVVGMTCEHCVKAVGDELRAIPGVTGVAVDLDSGRVEVTAPTELDEAVVRAAVDEAGYALAP